MGAYEKGKLLVQETVDSNCFGNTLKEHLDSTQSNLNGRFLVGMLDAMIEFHTEQQNKIDQLMQITHTQQNLIDESSRAIERLVDQNYRLERQVGNKSGNYEYKQLKEFTLSDAMKEKKREFKEAMEKAKKKGFDVSN